MAPGTHTHSKNLETCCRTCLNDASTKMKGIFEGHVEGQDSLTIAEVLNLCTTLKVFKEDGLPNKLCGSCYNCLMSFYDFRKLAETIDIQLRNEIKNSNKGVQLEVDIKVEHVNAKQEVNCDTLSTNLAEVIKEEFNFIDEANEDFTDDFTLDECDNTEDVKVNLKCELCYRKFTSLQKLEKHLERNSCDSIFTCNICSKTFKRHFKYVKHLVTHGEGVAQLEINQNNPNPSLECSVCDAKYKSVNSLAAHMRKHTKKGRVLACSICGKVFKKISHLKRHELCHDVNRPFKCSSCPKRFNTESLLNDHVIKHNKVKPHICPICNKGFAHLSTLSAHVKVHTREKPYLCPTCGKKFDSSTNLNQHMRRHVGLKMFQCSMCPRAFVTKGELQSHSVTHSRVRAWRCEQCGSTFTHRKTLDQHMQRHAGIKPHQCDTCPMRFLTRDHLKRHYRIHTGEKPYRCELCDRAFTQSNDLVKHRRAHLGDKLYKCADCSQSFRLASELRQHVSEHYLQRCTDNDTELETTTPDIRGHKSFRLASELRQHVSEHYLQRCTDNDTELETTTPDIRGHGHESKADVPPDLHRTANPTDEVLTNLQLSNEDNKDK